jgi:AcrR family transcriptional regulator
VLLSLTAVIVQPDPTIHRQVIVAARHLLAEDARAPISRIAREAGVSRATFYRHFGSRESLLNAIEVEPPQPARERIIEAAAELTGRGGLRSFSMEGLATAAGVSRATVYRLFPTKAILFGEIVRRYSPFEPLVELLAEHGHRPPAEVIPRITRTFASVTHPRLGIMRGLLLEATSVTPDAVRGVQPFMPEALAALGGYLARNMEAGLVRRMHPLLAVQACLGPIAFHLLTRQIAERVIGLDMPLEDAVEELTAAVLEGIAP